MNGRIHGAGRNVRGRLAASCAAMMPVQVVDPRRSDGAGAGRLGRLLLAGAAAAIAVVAPVLADSGGQVAAFLLGAVGLLLVAVLTRRVPDRAWNTPAVLVFPLAVAVALCGVSAAVAGLAAPLVGLLTLCFAYIGLTLPPRFSLLAAPPAAATFVYANAVVSRVIVIRAVIAVLVWVLLAQTLAGLAARQRELLTTLVAAADTDGLTGIPNRRSLDHELHSASARDALIVVDLDHFKRINDSLGHAAGDRILIDFAAVMRLTLRSDDFCARMGGEEFVVLLRSTGLGDVQTALDRLRSMWAAAHPDVTFSAGVALCRSDRSTLATVAAADHALYEAKAAGRNRDHYERDLVAV